MMSDMKKEKTEEEKVKPREEEEKKPDNTNRIFNKIFVLDCDCCVTANAAAAVATLLKSRHVKFGVVEVDHNQGAPFQKGAFEVEIETDSGRKFKIWSGLANKKKRVPEAEDLLRAVEEVFQNY